MKTLTLVAEGALPASPHRAVRHRVPVSVNVRLLFAVALEGVVAASVLATGEGHAVVAQVTLP